MEWARHVYKDWKKTPRALSSYLPNLDKAIEYWTKDKIIDYQTECVKMEIEHAYKNCAFYRKKFQSAGIEPHDIQTLEDLERVPLMSKDELRGDPWILLSVPKEDLALIHESTGTTGGEPNYALFTWNDIYTLDMGPTYAGLLPMKEGDIIFNALPYEMSSAGLSFHRVFQDGLKAVVVPVGKGGFYSAPDKTIKMMKKLQATHLVTTPSYAIYLSEVAESLGIRIGVDIKLKLIWITGEGCSPAFAKRLENIWDCPAYLYYGSLEAGPIGVECVAKQGLHITAGHVYVEIVDEKTGERLAPGEVGNIVITTLLREATPFIRYKTDDIGYIEDSPCPCAKGEEEPRVPEIFTNRIHLRGRKGDQITIGMNEYSPFYIEEFLMRIPEAGNWYQFIVDEKKAEEEGIIIQVELPKGFEPSGEIAEKIRNKVEYGCGAQNKVELLPFGTLPRPGGKVVRVIKRG